MINGADFIPGVVDKFPEKLLEGRVAIEGNLIACLFTDPTLYDDIKAQVGDRNFLSRDGRFLFGIVKLLREKKFAVIDEITVLSNCSESVLDQLKGLGGYKSVQNLVKLVDIKNFEGILDSFNKSNILLRLHSRGFNLFQEVKLPNGKIAVPFEMFSNSNWGANNVLEWYEEYLSKLSIENSSESTKVITDRYAGFDDDFLARISAGSTAGVSIADAGTNIKGENIHMYKFLSRNIMGLARATTTAVAAHSGTGKTVLMMNIVFALLVKGLKGVFVSNEMTEDALMTIILMIILTRYFDYWDITKQKLIAGQLTDENKEMIHRAKKYWDDNYGESLKIVTMSDADSNLTSQIIKKEALRTGIDFFVVDTFKLDIDAQNDDSYWINLIRDSRTLDSLAKKYDMIGLYTIQLNASSIGNLFLDASALSMSKAIKEVLTNLIMMRNVYPEEFAAGSPYDFKPFRSIESGRGVGDWHDEPYSLEEPNAVYRCIFINKTRQGTCSSDTGIAYLYKYKGDYCRFSETCKVRPVHKKIGQI